MFPFDHAALPQLTTRKALIGVDFQNDFVAPDGALPVKEAEALVGRTVKLASVFRAVGDVVWVQSQFEAARPSDSEPICVSDADPTPRPSSRGRRKKSTGLVEPAGPPDAEAFLSHREPTCARAGTPGCDMVSAIKDTAHEHDIVLTKSHYSAFNSTHLLRTLRAKMVMEVFICGSLANVGVHATALDAAGHGMAITVVDDCCGFRSDKRQTRAIASLIELTGCDVASCDEVLETLQPKPKQPPKTPTKPQADGGGASRKSETPDFVKDMTGLRLASNSPSRSPVRARAQPQPHEKAPLTSTIEPLKSRGDSQSRSPKPTEPDAKDSQLDAAQRDERIKAIKEDGTVPQDGGPLEGSTEKDAAPPTSLQVTEHSTASRVKTPPPYTEEGSVDKEVKPDYMAHPEIEETGGDEGQLHQKCLCEGDMDIIEDILPESLANDVFNKLWEEVRWQRMSHQGGEVPRLVAVQGEVAEDGSMPVYRHPSDESLPMLPFSPTVLAIKHETEKQLGHTLNHALIQFYRDGSDYISEHSDKTLDIVKGSYIANVSLGAERTMVLRTKRLDKDPSRTGTEPETVDSKRRVQRARLPHNSLCRMGLETNMKWLHAIRQDKRADHDKSATELAHGGRRISITFRQIGTFLDRDETLIWGQGATAKTCQEARPVVNGQTPEAIRLLKAFGSENHSSTFDWDAYYGKGFDVLHITSAPRLFTSSDPVVNMRLSFMLAECGINYAKGSVQAKDAPVASGSLPVKFIDNDAGKATVQGGMAIMLYLDSQYAQAKAAVPRAPTELATQLTRFQQGLSLLEKWRNLDDTKRDLKLLRPELATLDGFAGESPGTFLAGTAPSLPDYAVWPVLHAVVEESGLGAFAGLDNLRQYYNMVAERPSARKALGKEAIESSK